MNIKEQYNALQIILPQIDEYLQNNTFDGIKEMILWLSKSKEFQKLKFKEYLLCKLDIFCKIWIEEKKENPDEPDLFWNIHCLRDIDKKYRDIVYAALRIENQLPYEYCSQAINKLIENKVSGIAIVEIAKIESCDVQDNIIHIAEYMLHQNEITMAIQIFRAGQKSFPDCNEFYLREAECWLEGSQWAIGLECLKKIDNPDDATKQLMEDLIKVVDNEKIQ